ncbi:hypothetical protein BESB_015290 [Besnoitia besnoiti]|uniref:tRNA-specific adenosine deaminase 1 n=1 Tax=Besnoitia besnoiti TaxID=94643 RepID=A0A2A9MAE9_BESBE|nr:hypothetical protein BESB_015290 [Besnoitia besnoiti]PFH32916.1 hypothetical protein BESB_015290 [Besnoitia besnoiti]
MRASPGSSPASASASSLANSVAETLFRLYVRDIPRRGKPDEATGEWTVLAGFVLEVRREGGVSEKAKGERDECAAATEEGEETNGVGAEGKEEKTPASLRRPCQQRHAEKSGLSSEPRREERRTLEGAELSRHHESHDHTECPRVWTEPLKPNLTSPAPPLSPLAVSANCDGLRSSRRPLSGSSPSSPRAAPFLVSSAPAVGAPDCTSSFFHSLVLATGSRCIGASRLFPAVATPQASGKARPPETKRDVRAPQAPPQTHSNPPPNRASPSPSPVSTASALPSVHFSQTNSVEPPSTPAASTEWSLSPLSLSLSAQSLHTEPDAPGRSLSLCAPGVESLEQERRGHDRGTGRRRRSSCPYWGVVPRGISSISVDANWRACRFGRGVAGLAVEESATSAQGETATALDGVRDGATPSETEAASCPAPASQPCLASLPCSSTPPSPSASRCPASSPSSRSLSASRCSLSHGRSPDSPRRPRSGGAWADSPRSSLARSNKRRHSSPSALSLPSMRTLGKKSRHAGGRKPPPVAPEAYRRWTQGNCVCVHDSHAEVLARRLLKRYLALGALAQLHAFLAETRQRVERLEAALSHLGALTGSGNNRGDRGDAIATTISAAKERGETGGVCEGVIPRGLRNGGGDAGAGGAQRLPSRAERGRDERNEQGGQHAESQEATLLEVRDGGHGLLESPCRDAHTLASAVTSLAVLLLRPFPTSLCRPSAPSCTPGEPRPRGGGGSGVAASLGPAPRSVGLSEPHRGEQLNDARILEFLPLARAFRQRAGTRLHFYASMAPCGDAALTPRVSAAAEAPRRTRQGDSRNSKAGAPRSQAPERGGEVSPGGGDSQGTVGRRADSEDAREPGDGRETKAGRREQATEGWREKGDAEPGGSEVLSVLLASEGEEGNRRRRKRVKDRDRGRLAPIPSFRFRPTGAKPVSVTDRCDERGTLLTSDQDLLAVQKRGILRFKPGRSDLPSHMRSCSLSCSDKIWRWNCLGWEGAVLSRILAAPLLPFSISVGESSVSLSALQVSLLNRGGSDAEEGSENEVLDTSKLLPFISLRSHARPQAPDLPILLKTTSDTIFPASREAAERRRAEDLSARSGAKDEVRHTAEDVCKGKSERKRIKELGAEEKGGLRFCVEKGGSDETEEVTSDARPEKMETDESARCSSRGTRASDRPYHGCQGNFGVGTDEHARAEGACAQSTNPQGRLSAQAPPDKNEVDPAGARRKKTKEWEGVRALPPIRSSGLSIAWHRSPEVEFSASPVEAGNPSATRLKARDSGEACGASKCLCLVGSSKAFHEVTVGCSGLLHRTMVKKAQDCRYLHSELCKANLSRVLLHLTVLKEHGLLKALREAIAGLETAQEALSRTKSPSVASEKALVAVRRVLDEAKKRGLMDGQECEHTEGFWRDRQEAEENAMSTDGRGHTGLRSGLSISYDSLKARAVDYQARKVQWRKRYGGWEGSAQRLRSFELGAEADFALFDFVVERVTQSESTPHFCGASAASRRTEEKRDNSYRDA